MLLPFALLALSSALPLRQEVPAGPSDRALRWLDLDGDGDLDALHLRADGTLRLLRRDGRGAYVDATAEVGLDAVSGARALLAGDVDGDGRADLVVGGAAGLALWRQEEGGAFVDVTAGSGLEQAGAVLALDRVDLDGDGRPELHVEGADAHRLFRREASGRFAGIEELALGTGRLAAPPPEEVDEAEGHDATRPAQDGRALAAPRAAGAGAASSPAASGSPPALSFPGCIKAISDQALPGSCLEASSVPGLGLLHPLSVDFNVDPTTGWVALNTTSPDTRLHVVGRGRFQGNSEADTGIGTGMLQVLALDALSGLGIDSNEVQSWGAPLSLNPEGAFATRLNETLVVEPGGQVGVGREPTPNIALDVAGVVRADDTFVSTKPAGAPFQLASADLNANLNADLLDGLDASAFSQLGQTIETGELADGAVTDAKVAPGIAGEKVVPDFGAQTVASDGPFESTGPGGGFAAFNPVNPAASVRLDWLDGVARLRVGGSGAGATAGLDIQTTGDTSLLRLLNDGSVGIGTTTPSAPLHVRSDDASAALLFAESTATSAPVVAVHGSSASEGGTGVLGIATADSGTSYALRGTASGAGTPIGVLASAPPNGWTAFFPGRSYLERAGVGTPEPAATLDVAGDAIVGGPSAGASTLALRDATGSWLLEKEGYILSLREESETTAQLVIDRFEGVGVFRDDPQAALDVQAPNPGDLMRVRRGGGTVEFRINSIGWVGIGKTPSMTLDVDGTVICTHLIETSDARLKRDVRELEGALEAVLALRGVSYEWDREQLPDAPEGRRLGLLAQEVREVLPEAVREAPDGQLSVSYTSLVPVLAEGVGELNERVVQLEERLARLEALLDLDRR